MRYKNNAMENLASGLAAETLSYISSNDAVQGAVQEAWRQAQEAVNAELVQSEIAHIMMRNAQRFENSITPSFGYTLTAQERVSFENFSDAVQDSLRREMDVAISQLSQCYEESLMKMKRGQWRLHLEQERKASEGRQLLAEFSDIVAHKALVDARINVLKGDYISKDLLQSTKDNLFSVSALQKYENLFAELASDLEISNPDDILAEADFNFMYKYFASDFSTNKAEIKEISTVLTKLEHSIVLLQSTLNPNTSITSSSFDAENLQNICVKCDSLQSRVESMISSARLLQSSCEHCDKMQESLIQMSDQHENELDDLRKIHDDNLDALTNELEDQRNLMQLLQKQKDEIKEQLDEEIGLVKLHEKELFELSEQLQEHRKISEIKESDRLELNENLEEEREKSKLFVESIDELSDKCQKYTEDYMDLKKEHSSLKELLEKERERVRKLEKRLELLENEHSTQIEHLQESFTEQELSRSGDSEKDVEASENVRRRYQVEIEQLRTLCEKGLAAMESSHRRIISELEEKHHAEIQQLLCDKETALAEETQVRFFF